MLGALLVGMLAHAQGLDETLEDRIALQDALLLEAAHGDLTQAMTVYQRLARQLPDQAPLRGEALYWLGHGHFVLGHVEPAREALLEGIRSGLCPTRCRDLLEQVELEDAEVDVLPVQWTFDDGDEHGLFHPWRFQERGSLRSEPGRLVWTTESAAPGPPDRLVMSFDDVGRITAVTVVVRAQGRGGRLQVVVTDRQLNQFGLRDALRLPPDQRVVARLRPDDFVPVDGPGVRLDPSEVAELWLVDITPQAGPTTLSVERLVVR